MKLITANKLNRFWQNGILPELGKRIANSRVLKTSEEVEANTNEENIASANVVGELINKLAHGQIEFNINSDGEGQWRAAGADTWNPFKKYDVKASKRGATSSSQNSASISITVPTGVKRGLLVCVSTGWMSEITQSTPSGNGIKRIISNNYSARDTGAACSSYVSIYECDFNEGGTITLSYGNTGAGHAGYATGQFIIIA